MASISELVRFLIKGKQNWRVSGSSSWGKEKVFFFNFGVNLRSIVPFLLLMGFTALICSNPRLAMANVSFEFYGGYQTSPHSVVEGEYQANLGELGFRPFRITAGWKGKSFSMPPYYGLRFTKWNGQSGLGLDFTHTKAYADVATLEQTGFERLQFTDGLNNFTLHRQTKIDFRASQFSGYYGYGIGIIIPHVEFQAGSTLPKTYGYQYGGPTLALNTGLKVPLANNRYFFTEYKFTASWLNVNLNGGGSLETRIFTNALNVGMGIDF